MIDRTSVRFMKPADVGAGENGAVDVAASKASVAPVLHDLSRILGPGRQMMSPTVAALAVESPEISRAGSPTATRVSLGQAMQPFKRRGDRGELHSAALRRGDVSDAHVDVIAMRDQPMRSSSGDRRRGESLQKLPTRRPLGIARTVRIEVFVANAATASNAAPPQKATYPDWASRTSGMCASRRVRP